MQTLTAMKMAMKNKLLEQRAYMAAMKFMAVIYHTGKTEIGELLQSLSREKDRLNSNEDQIPIDYACGWAHLNG